MNDLLDSQAQNVHGQYNASLGRWSALLMSATLPVTLGGSSSKPQPPCLKMILTRLPTCEGFLARMGV